MQAVNNAKAMELRTALSEEAAKLYKVRFPEEVIDAMNKMPIWFNVYDRAWFGEYETDFPEPVLFPHDESPKFSIQPGTRVEELIADYKEFRTNMDFVIRYVGQLGGQKLHEVLEVCPELKPYLPPGFVSMPPKTKRKRTVRKPKVNAVPSDDALALMAKIMYFTEDS